MSPKPPIWKGPLASSVHLSCFFPWPHSIYYQTFHITTGLEPTEMPLVAVRDIYQLADMCWLTQVDIFVVDDVSKSITEIT
jgi:hypothetical protein